MKKILTCLFSIIVLLSATTVCYAGSVPEDLLVSDSSCVYFGEIKNIDGDDITVIQKESIKGEFEENREITYPEFTFIDSPEIGETYLLGYFDKNNPLYVWEVTSLTTKTLEIKSTDDMSKRMQEYLNDGKFEEIEVERLTKGGTNSNTGALSNTTNAADVDTLAQMDIVTQNENGTQTDIKTNISLTIVVLYSVTIVLVGMIVFARKNRKADS